MFSEEWQLDTQPVLNGGAAIRVVLRGLALQDDLNAGQRNCLEKELEGRQASQIVQSIVEEILNGIRSPLRPASPVDAYLTVRFLGKRRRRKRGGGGGGEGRNKGGEGEEEEKGGVGKMEGRRCDEAHWVDHFPNLSYLHIYI